MLAVLAALPGAVVGLAAFWTGTFQHAGRFDAVAVGLCGLVALALAGAGGWRDPLTLGRRWRLLPWLALAALLVSLLASPVPRAGAVGLAAMPLFLLLPAAVSRLGAGSRIRVVATTLVVALLLVSARALLGLWLEGHPRAALPLGHHNLLALWLLGLLPLACWLALFPEGGRGVRLLATASLLTGGAAIVATGSLSGALGAVAELAAAALLWWRRDGRSRRWLGVSIALALLLLSLQLPRLIGIVQARDVSVAARAAYFDAGLAGWRERPWLGQGPGATPWTVARFFEPVAGVHPPGQVLSDLHSVPLQLLYELGIVGCLPLVLVAAIWLRRRLASAPGSSSLERAALIGLLGMAAASVTSGLFGTTASVVLALVLAGLAVAASRIEGSAPGVRSRILPLVGVLALALLQLPPLLALREHAAARRLPEERVVRLERALRWDRHPLYAAQQAWWRAEEGAVDDRGWRLATDAARRARDVGVLWLSAGSLGLDLEPAAAREQLRHACRLDPFGAFAPFLLAASGPGDENAPRQLARALLLEPRLLAAPELKHHPRLRADAIREVLEWPGVPAGWREALARLAGELEPGSDATLDLALVVDRRAATSLSLFTFGRQPLPTPVLRIPIEAAAAASIELVPASTLPEVSRALGMRGCD